MLGNFDFQILNELIKGKSSIDDLKKKLSATTRQVDYSIKKINNVLSENRFEIIKRDYSGELKFDDNAIIKLIQYLKNIRYSDYYLNEIERQSMIISMILYQENQKISLYDFSAELKVSRNTIIKDIQNINQQIKEKDLIINYIRSDGYVIQGSELSIRRLIYALSDRLVQSFHSIIGFNMVNQIQEEYYYILERIERDLEIKFDDQYFEMLNTILHLNTQRVAQGHFVELSEHIYINEIILNVVRERTQSILKTEDEIYWFSLMVMSANVLYRYKEYHYPHLKDRVEEFVGIFESKSGIYIRNRQDFVSRLLVHLVPVVYRMLISISNDSITNIDFVYEYQHLINLVSESIGPIEELIDQKLPEAEVHYITMHVAIELMRLTEENKSAKNAALVSLTHGSMEGILYLQLQQLFDDFNFVGAFSQRQFYENKEIVDIVFTTIPLKTEIPQYVINSVLSYNDASRLVKKVYNVKIDSNIQYILNTVEDVLEIKIEGKNREMIVARCQDSRVLKSSKIPYHQNLVDYLNSELIVCLDAESIEEVMAALAEILVEKKYITYEYAKDLQLIDRFNANYMIGPEIMIPHIDRKEGVLKETIMLCILENPIDYFGTCISVICPLVIIDNNEHTLAISQLHTLAHKSGFVKTLHTVKDSEAIYKYIQNEVKEIEFDV